MRTPGERTSGAWTGGCVIHPDGGDETDRTAGNSYTATPHNTQGAIDIWSQYRFLDASIFGRNFYQFRNRYTSCGES